VTKVVGIGSGKKTPETPPTCPYCGKKPACVDFTCPRIASVWSDDSGSWEITFHPPHTPPIGDETA
jgi:hypothetical protein